MAYSEEFKARALIRLAENKNDFDITAEQLGCSTTSLRSWASGQHISGKSVQKKEGVESLTVAAYLEQAIKTMLSKPPEDMAGGTWGTALGILLDKWLILNDRPSERIETITRYLEDLPDNEYRDVIEEAEAIIRRAGRAGDSRGG